VVLAGIVHFGVDFQAGDAGDRHAVVAMRSGAVCELRAWRCGASFDGHGQFQAQTQIDGRQRGGCDLYMVHFWTDRLV